MLTILPPASPPVDTNLPNRELPSSRSSRVNDAEAASTSAKRRTKKSTNDDGQDDFNAVLGQMLGNTQPMAAVNGETSADAMGSTDAIAESVRVTVTEVVPESTDLVSANDVSKADDSKNAGPTAALTSDTGDTGESQTQVLFSSNLAENTERLPQQSDKNVIQSTDDGNLSTSSVADAKSWQASVVPETIAVPKVPITQTPITQTPITQTPITQTPITQTPITQTPITQTPITQTPITQTPITQTPIAQTPITQTPITQTLITQTPITQTPITQTPITQTPVTQTPITQTPITQATAVSASADSAKAVEVAAKVTPVATMNVAIKPPLVQESRKPSDSDELTVHDSPESKGESVTPTVSVPVAAVSAKESLASSITTIDQWTVVQSRFVPNARDVQQPVTSEQSSFDAIEQFWSQHTNSSSKAAREQSSAVTAPEASNPVSQTSSSHWAPMPTHEPLTNGSMATATLSTTIATEQRHPLSSQVSNAILDQLARQPDRKQDSITIKLDPPELGEMTIELSKTNGGLAVRVTAREAVTMDMLFSRGDEIESHLRDQNLDLKSLEFLAPGMTSGGGGSQGQQQSRDTNNEPSNGSHQRMRRRAVAGSATTRTAADWV